MRLRRGAAGLDRALGRLLASNHPGAVVRGAVLQPARLGEAGVGQREPGVFGDRLFERLDGAIDAARQVAAFERGAPGDVVVEGLT